MTNIARITTTSDIAESVPAGRPWPRFFRLLCTLSAPQSLKGWIVRSRRRKRRILNGVGRGVNSVRSVQSDLRSVCEPELPSAAASPVGAPRGTVGLGGATHNQMLFHDSVKAVDSRHDRRRLWSRPPPARDSTPAAIRRKGSNGGWGFRPRVNAVG